MKGGTWEFQEIKFTMIWSKYVVITMAMKLSLLIVLLVWKYPNMSLLPTLMKNIDFESIESAAAEPSWSVRLLLTSENWLTCCDNGTTLCTLWKGIRKPDALVRLTPNSVETTATKLKESKKSHPGWTCYIKNSCTGWCKVGAFQKMLSETMRIQCKKKHVGRWAPL